MSDERAKTPDGWGAALSEASSAAMMWTEAKVGLHKAIVAEDDAKRRFLSAMAQIDRIVRPLKPIKDAPQ